MLPISLKLNEQKTGIIEILHCLVLITKLTPDNKIYENNQYELNCLQLLP